jgi:hypothetical protein
VKEDRGEKPKKKRKKKKEKKNVREKDQHKHPWLQSLGFLPTC